MTKKKQSSKGSGEARKPTGKLVKSKNSFRDFGGEEKTAAVAYGRSMRLGRPQFMGGGQNIRVRHREFLKDVLSSTEFNPTKISINPGLPGTFPWLSGIARQFESYKFHRLQFLYLPICSTSSSGIVALAVDYDSADLLPEHKYTMSSFSNYVRAVVWQEACTQCPASDMQKFPQRYVRELLVADTDIKTYDVGNLIVATDACPADGTMVGEIYVDYEVELFTPQLHAEEEVSISARVNALAGVTRTAPFGTAPVVTGGLPCAATLENIIFDKVGEYLLDMTLAGTGLNTTPPNIAGTAPGKVWLGSIPNAAATSMGASLKCNVTEPGQKVTLDFTNSATTVSAMNTYIAPFGFSL